jgi:hypothetical protein
MRSVTNDVVKQSVHSCKSSLHLDSNQPVKDRKKALRISSRIIVAGIRRARSPVQMRQLLTCSSLYFSRSNVS